MDLIKAHNMNLSSLDQIFYVHHENEDTPCLESKKEEGEFAFTKGTYASMSFIVETEDCIKQNIDFF